MDRSVDAASVVERATDQLVDEICERHIALCSLVDATTPRPGPPVGNVREIAAELIGRLTTPGVQRDAAAIVNALVASPQRHPRRPMVVGDAARPAPGTRDGTLCSRRRVRRPVGGASATRARGATSARPVQLSVRRRVRVAGRSPTRDACAPAGTSSRSIARIDGSEPSAAYWSTGHRAPPSTRDSRHRAYTTTRGSLSPPSPRPLTSAVAAGLVAVHPHLGRRVWINAFHRPGEDHAERLEVAGRQDRRGVRFGHAPPVSHQVVGLVQAVRRDRVRGRGRARGARPGRPVRGRSRGRRRR